MKFLFPTFLYALFVLAIPLLIHFFNFKKYKTLYFSNVQILKTLKQESRKKSKLKQLLILISRLAALSAFVLAFSRPYIPLNNRVQKSAHQNVAIYIDNSFSMKANGEKGSLFEQARNKAIEIANSYSSGTNFSLLTNDFKPEHQHTFNREQLIEQLSSIKESPSTFTFSEIYKQAKLRLTSGKKQFDKTFYYLSDFQKYSTDIKSVQNDSTIWTYLIPFEAVRESNLFVDSCWFETPGRKIKQQEKLFARVVNLSDQSFQNIPIRLTINDSLRAISNINIDARQNKTIELNYTNKTAGIHLCEISIDDYPVTYDNSFYLSYLVRNKVNALGIYNPEKNGSVFLNALFKNDEFISYYEMREQNVLISQIKNYQCVYLLNLSRISSGLKNELISFVDQGGTIVIFPDINGDFESYNSLFSRLNCNTIQGFDSSKISISEINYNDLIYRETFKKKEKEADLPNINGYIHYNHSIKSNEMNLLSFQSGEKALSINEYGLGKTYTAAFTIDNSNLSFARHIVFVPTIYNIALNSTEPQSYSKTIGINNDMQLSIKIKGNGSNNLSILDANTNEQFLLSARPTGFGKYQIDLNGVVLNSGHYLLKDDEVILQPISYNYSRKESQLTYYSVNEINTQLADNNYENIQIIEDTDQSFAETLKEINNGKQLWKIFVGLTLLFVLCEALIIRFWK